MVCNPFIKLVGRAGNKFKSTSARAPDASEEDKSQYGTRGSVTHGLIPLKTRQALVSQAVKAIFRRHLSKKALDTKNVYKKSYIFATPQPKLATTSKALSTTLEQSNPFRKSHDLEVKDLRKDTEVNIPGIVVRSWSNEGCDTPNEAPAIAVVNEGHRDDAIQAVDSDEQDASQVSKVDKAQSTPCPTLEAPISTAVTMYRPCTYVDNVTYVAHTFQPETLPASAALACTAVVLYTPPVQVSESMVQCTQVLNSLLVSALFPLGRANTTSQVVVTLQPTTSSLPQPSTSNALVLYRTPAQFDIAFPYTQTWARLLTTATSRTERFWQGVLRRSCIKVYQNSIAVDCLAALQASSDHDLMPSGCVYVASDATAEGMLVTEEHLHAGAAFEEHNQYIVDHLSQPSTSNVDVDVSDDDSAWSDISSEPGESSAWPEAGNSTSATCNDHLTNIDIVEGNHGTLVNSDLAISEYDEDLDLAEGPLTEQVPLDHETEKQQLEEELQHQQSLCQTFRTQLVECEQRAEEAEARYHEVERQRDLYEEESEQASQQLNKVQEELTFVNRLFSEEKSKTESAAATAQHGPQSSADYNVPAIMAAYEREKNDAIFAREMLNTVVKERDELAHQLRSSQQPSAVAISRLNHVNDHLRDNIEGLQGQVNDLLQQKQVSNNTVEELKAQVTDLKAYNHTLLSDWTNKLIADPRDIVDPVKCTYNEARDLRQQVESAQATSAEFTETNQRLCKGLDQEKELVCQLRSDKDLLEQKCGRLSANFEMLQFKVNNWMETLPNILRGPAGMSEDEIAAQDKRFHQFQKHIDVAKARLKAAAIEVSDMKSKMVKMERRHKSELACFDGRLGNLMSEKVRLETDNIGNEMKLHDAEQNVKRLEQKLEEATHTAEQWREQAEDCVFGETSEVVREYHQRELTELQNQVYALQHMNTELRIGKEHAWGDAWLHKYTFANTIIKIEDWEAEWLFARSKCDAMEERFADALRFEPLRIQKREQYANLSYEQKMEILREEDKWIEVGTGFKLGRGLRPQPEPTNETWSTFIAECREGQVNSNVQVPEMSPPLSQNGVKTGEVQRLTTTHVGLSFPTDAFEPTT